MSWLWDDDDEEDKLDFFFFLFFFSFNNHSCFLWTLLFEDSLSMPCFCESIFYQMKSWYLANWRQPPSTVWRWRRRTRKRSAKPQPQKNGFHLTALQVFLTPVKVHSCYTCHVRIWSWSVVERCSQASRMKRRRWLRPRSRSTSCTSCSTSPHSG